MATKKPKTSQDRDDLLRSIHDRTAAAIDEILRVTPVAEIKASLIQSITQFLRLNDVSAGTLPDETRDAQEADALAKQVRESRDRGEQAEDEARARGEIVTGPILGKPFDGEDQSTR